MRSYYLCKEGLEGTTNGLQCIYVIGQIWVDFDIKLILILARVRALSRMGGCLVWVANPLPSSELQNLFQEYLARLIKIITKIR